MTTAGAEVSGAGVEPWAAGRAEPDFIDDLFGDEGSSSYDGAADGVETGTAQTAETLDGAVETGAAAHGAGVGPDFASPSARNRQGVY